MREITDTKKRILHMVERYGTAQPRADVAVDDEQPRA